MGDSDFMDDFTLWKKYSSDMSQYEDERALWIQTRSASRLRELIEKITEPDQVRPLLVERLNFLLTVFSAEATEANLKLQTEVRDLTLKITKLTVQLKVLTIGALIFAALALLCAAGQLYYGRASYILANREARIQAELRAPPLKP